MRSRFVHCLAMACCSAWLLGACNSDVLPTSGNDLQGNGANVAFGDSANILPSAPTGPSVVQGNSRIASTSADGSQADLVLQYELHPSIRDSLRAKSRLQVELYDGSGKVSVLQRARIDRETLSGKLVVTVPVAASAGRIKLELTHLASQAIDTRATYAVIDLPGVLLREPTDLAGVSAPVLTLEPGSYTSSLKGNRRIHRFAVSVSATDNETGEPVSVTGLEQQARQHFIAEEGGIRDIESPVEVSYAQRPLAVYFVLDVSSSITLAGAAHHLADSVARTIIALAPVAEFDYRAFASKVYRLGSLRELAFDDIEDSGTALYRSIDTALEAIELRGDSGQDSIIVAFTDGRDLASRNYYPAFRSHEQVLQYTEQRLRNVATAQEKLYGQRLESWFVSLGSDVDADAMTRLAGAGGTTWLDSFTDADIEQSFSHLSNEIKGVYYLEYSSQQTPDDTLLTLTVKLGDQLSQPITLPTRFGVFPVADTPG